MKPKKRTGRPKISNSCDNAGPVREALAPLMEGPTPELNCYYYEEENVSSRKESAWGSMRHWVREKRSNMMMIPAATAAPHRRSSADPRLLLGVLGCPLAPIPVSNTQSLPHLSIKGLPIEASSAQYIVQQYIAATGGLKLHNSIRNSYTMGRVRMFTSEFETTNRVHKNPLKLAENGWFVLWQMRPDSWHVQIEVDESSIQAGSNGKVVWRYTPWLGAHAANGPIRPLRRALQGLDPITTANLFIKAHCVGEKKIGEEDCFVLKLTADAATLAARSEGPAEIIRHVLLGYFSQRTGLLVFLEDSHLTRIQSNGAEAVYWETTIESSLQDYRAVEDMPISHAGHSVVTLFRFGEEPLCHTKTRMEEIWSIEEVAFNVHGLSQECFIPPSEISNPKVP